MGEKDRPRGHLCRGLAREALLRVRDSEEGEVERLGGRGPLARLEREEGAEELQQRRVDNHLLQPPLHRHVLVRAGRGEAGERVALGVAGEEGGVELAHVGDGGGEEALGEGGGHELLDEDEVHVVVDEGEELAASVELGDDAGDAPEVEGEGPAGLQGHLGGPVLHGADEGWVPVARVEGGPEVHHLDLDGALRRREEDVLRLEVGVYDGPLVDVADRVEELPRHVLQHRQGEGRVPGPAQMPPDLSAGRAAHGHSASPFQISEEALAEQLERYANVALVLEGPQHSHRTVQTVQNS